VAASLTQGIHCLFRELSCEFTPKHDLRRGHLLNMSVPRHAIIQHESPETVCSPEVTCFEIELTPESASKSTPNQSDQGHWSSDESATNL
jgi:hypothetical protein